MRFPHFQSIRFDLVVTFGGAARGCLIRYVVILARSLKTVGDRSHISRSRLAGQLSSSFSMNLSRLAFSSVQNVHNVSEQSQKDTSLTNYLDCQSEGSIRTQPTVFSYGLLLK